MTMWFTCDLCGKNIATTNLDERVQRASGKGLGWFAPDGKDYCDPCGAAHREFICLFTKEWGAKQREALDQAMEIFAASRKEPAP